MEVLDAHSVRQPRYPTLCGTGGFASRHYYRLALDEQRVAVKEAMYYYWL